MDEEQVVATAERVSNMIGVPSEGEGDGQSEVDWMVQRAAEHLNRMERERWEETMRTR